MSAPSDTTTDHPDPLGDRVARTDIATGLRLIGSAISGVRRDLVVSVAGAQLWMMMLIAVPYLVGRVVDRAIQVWGAAGVTSDLPLAGMYLGARTLRLADGPDEVHKILIAKNVLGRYATGDSWDFGN